MENTNEFSQPPLFERIIRISADIEDELYLSGMDEWVEFLQSIFPDLFHEKKKEWKISISNNEVAFPIINEEETTLSILHRFWSSNPEEKEPEWCVQLSPDRLILNMRNQGWDDSRRFPNLVDNFKIVHHAWESIFNPVKKNMSLQYYNILNEKTLPQYSDQSKCVNLGKILAYFEHVNLPNNSSFTPYHECKFDYIKKAEDSFDYYISFILKNIEDSKPLTSTMTLYVQSILNNDLPIEPKMNTLHELLIESFNTYLSDEAIKSFQE